MNKFFMLFMLCFSVAGPVFGQSQKDAACFTIGPAKPSVGPAQNCDNETLVSYREISGFWTSFTTGYQSDFSLKNVKVVGNKFSADFSLQSAGQLRCAINDLKVEGLYENGVLHFRIQNFNCTKDYTVQLNISAKRGEYFTKVAQGVYTVQKIE